MGVSLRVYLRSEKCRKFRKKGFWQGAKTRQALVACKFEQRSQGLFFVEMSGVWHFSETPYDRMARCKEQGAVGVGELAVNQWLDSPFLTALFAAAQRLELPVTCLLYTSGSPPPCI